MTRNKKDWCEDPVIKEICKELSSQHDCHTIILYGSRATGNANSTSDYDVAGIFEQGVMNRIARFDSIHQVFIDLFVYPESVFQTIQEEHLIMHDGIVLKEKEQFGTHLLEKINEAMLKPSLLAKYELGVRRIWYQKMIMREKIRDVDGVYRHLWALHALLEDYFAFRHLRYLGPKKAFEYLKEHDQNVFERFEAALNDTKNIHALEFLVEAIVKIEHTHE